MRDGVAEPHDHRLAGREIRPGQPDEELARVVAEHLVGEPQVRGNDFHRRDQRLRADGVAKGRIDLPDVVEFHQGDTALPVGLPCQRMPLAQVSHHLPGAVRVGQRISTVQRAFDLAPDEIQRVTQSRTGFFELFNGRPTGGHTCRQASQQPGGDSVLILMLGTDHGERRQFPEFGKRPFEIPLTKQAATVRIRRQVVRITRPPSRDHAQQMIAPHGMVERGLVKLLQGLLEDWMGSS